VFLLLLREGAFDVGASIRRCRGFFYDVHCSCKSAGSSKSVLSHEQDTYILSQKDTHVSSNFQLMIHFAAGSFSVVVGSS
jgi:hypothetical protein